MKTIESYAEENDVTIGEAIYRVIRYLCDNPTIVSQRLHQELANVGEEDIEEAIEALEKDERY